MKEGLLVGFLSAWLGCWVISIFSVLFTKEASHMHLDGVVISVFNNNFVGSSDFCYSTNLVFNLVFLGLDWICCVLKNIFNFFIVIPTIEP
jgi:ABC-type Mn2+/Zn2+ transport system permease subunit